MGSPWSSRLALLALLACACPGKNIARSYPPPTVADIVAHLQSVRERVPNLKSETKADAWIQGQRRNVTVYIGAEWGGRLRFQAMNPNDSMAADLASDGATYCMIDANKNCGQCGPATPETVGQILRIFLQPDEVVAVLVGGAPVLADGDGTVTWDKRRGAEVVELASGDYTQRLVVDGRNKTWDLLEAEVKHKGELVWRIQHKDFHPVQGREGVRLPGASLFVQKTDKGEDSVRITWNEQEVGTKLSESMFKIDLQPGLPSCGAPPPTKKP